MAIQRIKRENREEWLKLRKNYIGGSDAASIVGLNDYQSPYALWCEKRGITPEFEGNLRTEVGAYLEDFIAKRFEQETGKRVQRSNFSFVNESYPWAIADVDREIVGENAGLECKSTSALNLKHYKNGDYPARFYVQCVHYMAVKGYERMYLAVLIGNSDFKIFVIDRDEAEIAALMTAEKDFYGFMESGNPPPIDGSGSTREAIQAQQSEPPEEEPEPADLEDKKKMLDTLGEIESAIAQLEEQRDAIRNQVIEAIGDSWRGNVEGYEVTYKPTSRKTFDWKKLQKDYPKFQLDPFFKTSVSRTLKIKRIEEAKEQ
jgi:putative phage-type endonuclease